MRARRPFRRGSTSTIALPPGERLLASASIEDDRELGGTRDALYLPRDGGGHQRLAWEDVEAAAWDLETSELVVSEVGTWGEARPEHRLVVAEPGRLLELVRERVTASVVYQRHVALGARRGLRVIARQAPGRRGEIRWIYEYDRGVDPEDPEVRLAASEALVSAQEELGLAG
ncbi:hypothetical protein [Nocardioides sp. R-C-SC26]|uniref:hypothetical protein n=1 Tax=Nocardioides sp. R-C-SC26 TaxID=2870414 RepID=UPI001E3D9452|nr:hypothetical protein [Nocardioides sp. R-C-SC26]